MGKHPNIFKVIASGMANMNKYDVKSKDIPVHTALASAYGKLGKGTLLSLDKDLQVMMAGTLLELRKLHHPAWKKVVSTMMSSSVLQSEENPPALRSSVYTKSGTAWFKGQGGPDKSVVAEVNSWFINLIQDSDVLADTKIGIDFLAKVVASTGAQVVSFATAFYNEHHFSRDIVDIGVLRYPDRDNPFFKVYRITIHCWADSKRILIHQTDSNGISGTFQKMLFHPRASIVKQITGKYRDKAVKKLKDLLSEDW